MATQEIRSGQILDGTIVNADVAAAAAIAYSKLNLTGSVVNADVVSLAWSKLTGTPTTLAGYGITDAIALTTAANTFTAAQTINAAAGLNAWNFKVGGVAKAYVGLSGYFLGTSATDLMLATETGGAIRFFVNGSANGGAMLDTASTFYVGDTTVATGQIELRGNEAAVRLQMYSTTLGAETYTASFGPDAGATNRKMGAAAYQFTDRSATNGYCSWNIHTTTIVAGVSQDSFGLAVWGGHGAAFFPASLGSSIAPGDRILRVHGHVDFPQTYGITGRSVGGGVISIVKVDANNNGHMIFGHSADFPLCLVQDVAANINTGSAAMNGGLLWDSTNSWLVGYVNGTRYKFVGTAY